MVSVACKRPNGLILELKKHDGTIERVTLKGATQSSFFKPELGMLPGLYGITEVPEEFWQEWTKVNKDYSPLVNKEIFAQPTEKEVEKQAEELKDEQTGLEGVNEQGVDVKTLSEKEQGKKK
ncbi:unnamed protein product [Commensalibacter communis]|uniref:Uncharacterized protein n=2 Tax=Commensalibacter communis TaxID=2972786 RepID=A0A9W4TRI5_9PROT|nr:unnamed protein product [Commensalibacter communis]CAI3961056.1 unnamed protein product [Commensalibacter communis]